MVVGGGSVDGLAESFASGVDSAGGAWNSVGGVEDSAGRAAGSAGGAGDSVGGGVICILMCPWQRPAELGLNQSCVGAQVPLLKSIRSAKAPRP